MGEEIGEIKEVRGEIEEKSGESRERTLGFPRSFFWGCLGVYLALGSVSCGKFQSRQDLYLGVELPIPEEIPKLAEGTSQKILKDWQEESPLKEPRHLVKSYKDIWVRMFPILSTPYRDPYPLTQNIYRLDLFNSRQLRVSSRRGGGELVRGRSLSLRLRSQKLIVDGVSLPLREIWIRPVDKEVMTTLRWDRGKKNAMVLELRGDFVVEPTLFSLDLVPKSPVSGSPVAGGDWGASSLEARPHLSTLLETQEREYWSLINVLPINEYLLSVVPSEVLTSWHGEALKAQAIAARTYALFEMVEARELKKRSWDVDPTTWYQSYRGHSFGRGGGRPRTMEVPATSAAVENTANLALFHQGEILKAYFSSNSGGITCTATECFGLPDNPPYLVTKEDVQGIREQTGETGTWGNRAQLTRQKIVNQLRSLGLRTSGFRQIKNGVRGPSTRTWQIKVEYKDGRETLLSRKNSRKIMSLFGPIRSYLYELSPMANGVQRVRGHGYGHGVGMSQWGAQLFAKRAGGPGKS